MNADTMLPLLAAQREIWFAEQRLSDGNSVYQVGEYVDVQGEFDTGTFERALRSVVAGLDTVHSRFHQERGRVGQTIDPDRPWELRTVDLSDAADPPAEADAWMRAELARPTDLDGGPLFHFALLRLGPERHLWYQNYHHIAMDAYGSSLVSRRVAEVYTALTEGREPGPDPFGSLRELADEDAAYRSAPAFQQDRDFWLGQLGGRAAPSPLVSRSRGASAEFRGATRWLPEERFEAVRRTARTVRVPWPVVVTAAVALHVQRLTGDENVLIAFPLSARASQLARQTPANLANVLPLPLTVRPDMTVTALLEHVAEQMAAAVAHQRYRGVDLQRDLGMAAATSLLPVVNVMSHPYDLRFGAARGTMRNLSSGLVGNLLFMIWDRQDGQGLQIDVNGRDDLGLADHRDAFTATLEALTATDPAQPLSGVGGSAPVSEAPVSEAAVSAVPVSEAAASEAASAPASAAPASQATAPASAAATAVPAAATVPDLFAARAAATPDAPALTADGTTWSYRELDERSNRVARALIARGVGPEDVVAVALPRSADLVLALLGVLKSGAAYAAVDPDYPPARIAYMLQDAAPKLLITSSTAGITTDTDHLLIDAPEFLADADADADAAADPDPDPDPAADDRRPVGADERLRPLEPGCPAYLTYTSGSTGRPKGVITSHENVVRLFTATRDQLGHGPDDVWTLFHSAAFDFSVWEIWGALLHGGRLVVVPFEVSRAPQRFLRLLADERVTVLSQTPSAFYQLMAADQELPEVGRRLRLRTVVFGGEALQPARLDDWRRRHGTTGPALVNMYGITETTVHVTHVELGPEHGPDSVIGVPLADLTVHLLDERLRPVPVGAIGEMYVHGPGLARGYLGRPGLTAHRFVADPHGRPGLRMYRTGDLARRDPAGRLTFVGRADDQIKVRGFRIEPGEIEAALAECPGVALAAVARTEEREDDQRLVAFVVAEDGADPGPEEIKEAVRARLPEYMVPGRIVRLDALPLTANGKLDRAALTAATNPAPAPADGALSSRLDIMRALFALVLDEPEVGPDDDFFDLGGHSVLATALITRIRSTFSAEIDLRVLFDDPTPRAVAAALDDAGLGRPPLVARERPADLDASFAQRRMWFLQQMDGPGCAYNIPSVLRIDGPLDAAALSAALGDVVARHESLRTVLPYVDGRLLQRVLPTVAPALHATPVTEAELEERLAAGARRAFDLAVEPPLRAELFTTGAGAHVLLLVLHHSACDATSMRLLARDLERAYAARVTGRAPRLDPVPVRYGDYTLWQNDLLTADGAGGGLLDTQVAYWREQLAGLPEQTELPTDRPRPAVASYTGDHIAVSLDAGLHRRLVDLGRASGASLFMVLHAGLAALLSRLGAGDDIAVGSPVAGRPDEALEDVVGAFVNTLVLRTDLSGRPAFADLLQRVRETALAAYAHQDVPFEYLTDVLAPERSPARHPLFQVMLGLQDTAPAGEFTLPGLTVSTELGRTGTAKFDLFFCLVERHTEDGAPAGLEGYVEYASDLFEPGTARTLFDRFARLLAEAAADPARPVDRFDLLTAEERTRLLALPAPGAADLPEATVTGLFERQAAATPAALAVSADGRDLTYADLDTRANQWARALAGHGVRVGDTVAVALPRSPESVVALLAVLKAGAAYVPIDPRYPAAQVATMVEETRPRIVLTSRDFDAARLPDTAVPRLLLDEPDTAAALAAQDTAPPDPATRGPLHPLSAAYVMYTSGSSGRPKGIVVTHRDVAALATDPRFGDGVCADVLAHSPAAFDASTFETWAPLLRGGRLILAPPHELDAEEYAELITRHRPSALWLTAALFAVVAEYRPDCFAGVRQVWAGGEEIAPSMVRRVLDACPDTTVVNGYGPTETTTFATSHAVRALAPDARTVPIGRPLAGMRAYVLDAGLQPLPPGSTGELYLAGAGVARGYLGRPAGTAERFVADPYGPAGDRMYRTGDLARWTPDGVLEYRGRTDRQVKLRGFRVEPGQVEAVLLEHPAVAQAVAEVRREGEGEARLVAYVVPAEGARPTVEALRAFAGRLVPQYLVPHRIVVLDALPVTAHGKLDRAALPAVAAEPGGRAPAGPAEHLLCALMARVLGRDEVGADDDFFALGGDSISAIRLVSAARGEGLTFTVRDVFAHRSAAELSRAAAAPGATPDGEPAETGTGPVPATPIVHWLRERGAPVHRFAQSLLLSCPPGLSRDALRAAVRALTDTHDALRLRLADQDGSWTLEIRPPGQDPDADLVHRVDASGLDAAGLADRARAEVSAAADRLDPYAGRIARLVWFDQGPRTPGRLLLVVHHLAVDGVSWRVLVDDLVQAYTQAAAGRAPVLPPVATSLRHWARRLTAQATEPQRLAELPRWIDVLDGPDPLLTAKPADPRIDLASDTVDIVTTLPEELVGPLLTSVPAAFHCGVEDVLLTALGLAVAAWRRDRGDEPADGVLVDVEGHGREDVVAGADVTRTLGWFTTIHPVRVDPGRIGWTEVTAGDPRLGAAVKRVKEQACAAPDGGIGFGLLRHLTPGCREVLARLGIPQIGFNYLGRFAAPGAPLGGEPGWGMAPEGVMVTTTDPGLPVAHGLEVHAVVRDAPAGPRLTVTWTGAGRLWSDADLTDLGGRWTTALEGIVRHALAPDAGGHTPSDFPLADLTQNDIDDVEAAW
ncbi:amino acid adenylation domain-containing protein [Streptomyces sp. NPDC006259]|uniref:amino acid adenylation domain-containing protein n=1 Tax=Streptomyces sp. NPDC006259 TaxID=3364740 RepID=UPI00367D59D3